jgi:hypothetical protein
MANTLAPIEITLYEANDEIKATYSRSHIPWGLLKKAIELSSLTINPKTASIKEIDMIAGLVVEIFGNQFTIKDLDEGADIMELAMVVQSIISRAGNLVKQNPTLPHPRRPKHPKK